MVVFGLVVVSTASTGVFVRRMLLPSWSGASARLAEIVVALAVLIECAQLLGALGAFSRWPLLLSYVATAVLAGLTYRRVTSRRVGARPPVSFAVPRPPSPERAAVVAGVLTVGLALIPWVRGTLNALRGGMREWDTLQYHMPAAARFVQDGSVTRLHYFGNAPVSFYPMNSELVHAIGILMFQRDILSPVLNLAWLGVALLAGWCIGEPRGVAPATMASTAVAASLPVIVGSQAGSAKNDIVGLALLMAAVALVVRSQGSRAALVLAALAAGLAAGTRLNLWAPVIALAVVAVVAGPRCRRVQHAALWIAAIAAGSSLWYVRNLAEVGNPLPWFGSRIGLPTTTAPRDCGTTSLAHYATNPGFLKNHVVPQVAVALGPRWWLVAFLAVVGVVGALVACRAPVCRGLALIALTSAVAYVFTPATAGGENAACFAYNTRFAAPAFVLGLVLVPVVFASTRSGRIAAAAATAVALLVIESGYARTFAGFVTVSKSPTALAATAVLTAAVAAVAFSAWRLAPRSVAFATLAVLVFAGVTGGWWVQRAYLRDRYSQARLPEPIEGAYGVLSQEHHARVAVSGFFENYPFYGADVSNRVDIPARRKGARFVPYTNCRTWLEALEKGHYDYVVTAAAGGREAPAAVWTSRRPDARVLHAAHGEERSRQSWTWQVFKLDRDSRAAPRAACRGLREASPSVLRPHRQSP